MALPDLISIAAVVWLKNANRPKIGIQTCKSAIKIKVPEPIVFRSRNDLRYRNWWWTGWPNEGIAIIACTMILLEKTDVTHDSGWRKIAPESCVPLLVYSLRRPNSCVPHFLQCLRQHVRSVLEEIQWIPMDFEDLANASNFSKPA